MIGSSLAGALLSLIHVALAINSVTVGEQDPQAAAAAQGVAQPTLPKPSDAYKVVFTVGKLNDGSSGEMVIQVHPEWAPLGAQRFKRLVDAKFYDNNKFFRVVSGFMAQFGISGDTAVNSLWSSNVIVDDPDLNITNKRGRVTFATAGKDTRSTQIFINTVDNLYLDEQGYTPFAEVIAGMDVVDKLYAGYGEGTPLGKGPGQNTIEHEGNAYLDESFPQLSTIQTARIFAPASTSTWGHARSRIPFTLLGLAVLLGIGITTMHRTGLLGKLHARLRSSMSSAAAEHEP